MKALRALPFRRVTLPTIADIQWAKSVARGLHPGPFHPSRSRNRPRAKDLELLWRMEMIATTPAQFRKQRQEARVDG